MSRHSRVLPSRTRARVFSSQSRTSPGPR